MKTLKPLTPLTEGQTKGQKPNVSDIPRRPSKPPPPLKPELVSTVDPTVTVSIKPPLPLKPSRK